MTQTVIFLLILWVLSAVGTTLVINRTRGFTPAQKFLLHITAWAIPIVGPIIDIGTLHSRNQLPWQNRNIEHAIETPANHSDTPDIADQDN